MNCKKENRLGMARFKHIDARRESPAASSASGLSRTFYHPGRVDRIEPRTIATGRPSSQVNAEIDSVLADVEVNRALHTRADINCYRGHGLRIRSARSSLASEGGRCEGVTGLNIYSMIVAVVGAIVVLLIYNALMGLRRV